MKPYGVHIKLYLCSCCPYNHKMFIWCVLVKLSICWTGSINELWSNHSFLTTSRVQVSFNHGGETQMFLVEVQHIKVYINIERNLSPALFWLFQHISLLSYVFFFFTFQSLHTVCSFVSFYVYFLCERKNKKENKKGDDEKYEKTEEKADLTSWDPTE